MWKYINNKKEAMEIFTEVVGLMKAEHPKSKVTAKGIQKSLMEDIEAKVKGRTIKDGNLKVVLERSRPVRIEYLDTNQIEEIQTIWQLAAIGSLYAGGGVVQYRQVWIGRVFPQWRAFG